MAASRASATRWLAAVVATTLTLSAPLPAQQGDSSAEDPRHRVVSLGHELQTRAALEEVDRIRASDPEAARRLGLDYLRGHLLLRLDRRTEAFEAFASAMTSTPRLEPWARFHLGREQLEMGHPEVAAGLLATLLSSGPPPSLAGPAMQLFEQAIAGGGDCRLQRNLDRVRLSTEDRRRLFLIRARCTLAADDTESARDILLDLLEDKVDDPVAFGAAAQLANLPPESKPPRSHYLIGQTFHQHREFEDAIYHLARALVQLSRATDVSDREAYQLRYSLARSHFWLGRHREAAAAFGNLAATVRTSRQRAQALYQRARSLELAGDWTTATRAFYEAHEVEPSGRWSDAALIAAMRLRFLAGDEDGALQTFETLRSRRKHDTTSRALLFLAASDLVRERTDRAQAWLGEASRLGRTSAQEIAFWHARLEEGRGATTEAVTRYATVLSENSFHPFAEITRERLRQPELAQQRRIQARRLAGSTSLQDRYRAWLLSEPGVERQRIEADLLRTMGNDPAVRPFLSLQPSPIPEWPMWNLPGHRGEEILLTLGLFDEAESIVLSQFPAANPSLAFAGSLGLARSGATRRSLYIAEILAKRIPPALPTELQPSDYRQLLYPFRYSFLILSEAQRHGIDPFLLAGIIREESRFDPGAFSGAAARGLTQFVIPTAREVAPTAGFPDIVPEDLERPEVAVALGAAYLADLEETFEGSRQQVIAAYNAGEPQARLWRRYCFGEELGEYLTKVAFRETRGYLAKVLTSRNHYADLYGPQGPGPIPSAAD